MLRCGACIILITDVMAPNGGGRQIPVGVDCWAQGVNETVAHAPDLRKDARELVRVAPVGIVVAGLGSAHDHGLGSVGAALEPAPGQHPDIAPASAGWAGFCR